MYELSFDQLLIWSAIGLMGAFLAAFVAYLVGFFHIPLKAHDEEWPLDFKPVISGFAIFALVKYMAAPLMLAAGYYLYSGSFFDFDSFSASASLQGWFALIVMVLLLLAYLVFFAIRPEWIRPVFGMSSSPVKDFFVGVVAWMVAYPSVFAINHLIDAILRLYYEGPFIEQVAVQHLRMIAESPMLFWLTAISLIAVVPIVEEMLFRGMLQTWLKSKLGAYAAVQLTALGFALVHYSASQGIFNLSLVPSLFVLGLFLGFLKERQNSLIAPVALHGTVNAISFFIILLQEKLHDSFIHTGSFIARFFT